LIVVPSELVAVKCDGRGVHIACRVLAALLRSGDVGPEFLVFVFEEALATRVLSTFALLCDNKQVPSSVVGSRDIMEREFDGVSDLVDVAIERERW
jgi:hypothetical protein